MNAGTTSHYFAGILLAVCSAHLNIYFLKLSVVVVPSLELLRMWCIFHLSNFKEKYIPSGVCIAIPDTFHRSSGTIHMWPLWAALAGSISVGWYRHDELFIAEWAPLSTAEFVDFEHIAIPPHHEHESNISCARVSYHRQISNYARFACHVEHIYVQLDLLDIFCLLHSKMAQFQVPIILKIKTHASSMMLLGAIRKVLRSSSFAVYSRQQMHFIFCRRPNWPTLLRN